MGAASGVIRVDAGRFWCRDPWKMGIPTMGGSTTPKTAFLSLLEFRVWLGVFRQRSSFDRGVCGLWRPRDIELERCLCGDALTGGPVPRSGPTFFWVTG